MAGWDLLSPVTSHKPCLWSVALGVCVQLRAHGHMEAAIAIVLAFAGFLRNSEVCSLWKADVMLPSDSRAGPTNIGSVRVRVGKTGLNQFACIREPIVLALLRDYLPHVPAGGRLFPSLNPSKLRTLFRRGQALLGFRFPPFTVHSLRHGAAVHAQLLGVPVTTIMNYGRWESLKTIKLYLQTGLALRMAIEEFPASVEARIKRYVDDPWTHLQIRPWR